MKEHKLHNLPLGYSDFGEIINGDCVYIDKTQLIYQMITSGKYYFLSRPRRFGKSLLISTLHALFSGKKELFKNQWIYTSDYDWQPYNVIRLDFSQASEFDAKKLEMWIHESLLQEQAEIYNVDLSRNTTIAGKFSYLIRTIAKQRNVVVLIDEYDKPILDHITNAHEAVAQRRILKELYSVLKGKDAQIRFALLTGVSKFSKTSVFSGINNLHDITLSEDYAQLLGYTEQELEHYFAPYMPKLTYKLKLGSSEIIQTLKTHYDGYQFAPNSARMFNPYSILSCLKDTALNSYWLSTGTPTFLLDLIKKNEYPLSTMYNPIMRASDLDAFEPDNIEFTALLYQTGYLTIKEYKNGDYTLDFPNFEVADGFNLSLSRTFTGLTAAITGSYARQIWQKFIDNDMPGLQAVLQEFFDSMQYDTHVRHEYDLRLILCCVFKLIGIEVSPEVKTSRGVADLVVELPERMFVIELKFNKTAQEALQQIQDMRYYAAYLASKKQIMLVGINFKKIDKTITLLSQEV